MEKEDPGNVHTVLVPQHYFASLTHSFAYANPPSLHPPRGKWRQEGAPRQGTYVIKILSDPRWFPFGLSGTTVLHTHRAIPHHFANVLYIACMALYFRMHSACKDGRGRRENVTLGHSPLDAQGSRRKGGKGDGTNLEWNPGDEG